MQKLPQKFKVIKAMDMLHMMYPTHPMHEAFSSNSFKMLIAVILSQRATDRMTIPVSKELFNIADTPEKIVSLDTKTLESTIRKIGFYKQKARALQKLSKILIEKYHSNVPTTENELLSLPQVGRKTANIILTMFFDTPQIAVDVHVHRIANRLGWIKTKKPEESEVELTKIIPKKYVPITNQVFVRLGQEICKPIHPTCNECPLSSYCQKVGIT